MLKRLALLSAAAALAVVSQVALADTASQVLPGYASTSATDCPAPSSRPCWVPYVGGNNSALNITSATNIKPAPGRVLRVILNTAGSTASSIIDSTGTTATAANTILTIPSTATAGTVYYLDWPALSGISVVPGTSAVISISYN